jgi:hypothetical protein
MRPSAFSAGGDSEASCHARTIIQPPDADKDFENLDPILTACRGSIYPSVSANPGRSRRREIVLNRSRFRRIPSSRERGSRRDAENTERGSPGSSRIGLQDGVMGAGPLFLWQLSVPLYPSSVQRERRLGTMVASYVKETATDGRYRGTENSQRNREELASASPHDTVGLPDRGWGAGPGGMRRRNPPRSGSRAPPLVPLQRQPADAIAQLGKGDAGRRGGLNKGDGMDAPPPSFRE